MSLTSKIASSEDSFKLSQKIVAALAEKFSFKFEEGWSTISSRPIETIQKRLRREKRRANPTSSIKHARTAFSFFTQKQRPLSQTAHPEASFGQLSRYVSEAWKALTPAQMTEFKTLEMADKERYQKERAEVLANLPVATDVAVAPVEEVAEPVKEKKVRKAKSAEAKAPETPAPATEAPAKKAKTPKAKAEVKAEVNAEVKAEVKAEPKAKTPKVKAAKAEPVEASTETAKPAKKAKTPKA
jgi:hypothetical protein